MQKKCDFPRLGLNFLSDFIFKSSNLKRFLKKTNEIAYVVNQNISDWIVYSYKYLKSWMRFTPPPSPGLYIKAGNTVL